jgi:hypothetical protein
VLTGIAGLIIAFPLLTDQLVEVSHDAIENGASVLAQ